MVKSWYGKLLAVRKVAQENKGKKTAGVDGIKSISPSKRLALVDQLAIDGIANPTRRVWIPKPGKKEMRPLGIPTMLDRSKQSLLKLAIEPEWEAKFLKPTHLASDQVGRVTMQSKLLKIVSRPNLNLFLMQI